MKEGHMTNFMKRAAPWVSIVGIFTLIAGLGLDAILHRRDATLAAREGIFTLSNPGHLLFAIGIALTVLGAIFYLMSCAFDGKFSLPRFALWGGIASLLVVCALVSFALAASTDGALAGSHTHSSDESVATSAADSHTHDLNNPDQLSHQHLESGAHIQLTSARPQTAEDIARANTVKQTVQQATEKYRDVSVAERDGYKMFGQGFPGQTEYHFSNTVNSILAAFTFDATQPTSLLYAKDAIGKFVLTGVMYHTPANFAEKRLDQRYPISMGQWHKHVNVCVAPKNLDVGTAYLGANAKYGPNGSITTQAECNAANGKFMPNLFGWMAHVYFN